jgi:hypothetical protein
MGIKFKCPQGHRIHVKAFLAGKRALCPHCGAKVVVPLANGNDLAGAVAALAREGETSAGGAGGGAGVAGGGAARVAAGGETATASGTSPGIPHLSALGTGPTLPPITAVPVPSPITARESPLPASGPGTAGPIAGLGIRPLQLAPSAAVDPIAEAPLATWYVRPTAGGQFGPAPGHLMRQWVAEGRVGADALVWREGWPEWRRAAAVFPPSTPSVRAVWSGAAAAAAPPAAAAAPATMDVAWLGASLAHTPARTVVSLGARRSKSGTLAMIVILSVLAAALAATLVFVVNRP